MSLSGSQKKGKKFLNPIHTDEAVIDKMIPILKEYWNNKAETTPKNTLGPFKTDVSIYNTSPESGLRVTWVGHSSLLIEIDGRRILTDPVWSQRVSFSQSFGPKRFFQPPLALEDLPALDAVIISHDHYDHLDDQTVRRIISGFPRARWFAPLHVGDFLKREAVRRSNQERRVIPFVARRKLVENSHSRTADVYRLSADHRAFGREQQ